MFAKMEMFEEEGFPALHNDQNDQLKMVYSNDYVYFTDLSTYEVERTKTCDLMLMREQFSPMFYAFGVQNNSAYVDIFSQR